MILNNTLSWDGTLLGRFNQIIANKWLLEDEFYYGLKYNDGIIYCKCIPTKDTFFSIVEDIKPLFKIPRRGHHKIIMDDIEYIMYDIPIKDDKIVWETPVNKLDKKHRFRKDTNFKKSMQEILLFCDIMALTQVSERFITIRSCINDQFVLTNVNTKTTVIKKENVNNQFCEINKTLTFRWFNEDDCTPIVKRMIDYKEEDTMAVVLSNYRNNIDAIIYKYDNKYIWYSYFIIDRLSKYLQ
jgi:hypothetical protein